jgi:hypothetical protein
MAGQAMLVASATDLQLSDTQSSAAARSSSAQPTDLNTVICVVLVRP